MAARRRRSQPWYWLVGPTGADLGPDGSEDGYTLDKAREEAETWIDAGVELVEIVPVGEMVENDMFASFGVSPNPEDLA